MGHHRHSIADVFHRASKARSDPDKSSGFNFRNDNNQDPRPFNQLTDKDKKRQKRKAFAARKVGTRLCSMARGITVESGAADNIMPRRMV